VRSRLLDSDAAEKEVDMFISQKDGPMSRILTLVPPNSGRSKGAGIASVVQRMLDLMRQARQRAILRD
jgi:hypothetical protein